VSAASFLDRAIEGFDRDPADSDYQRGYLEALKVARAESGIPQALDAAAEMAKAVEAFVGNHGYSSVSVRIHNARKRLSFALGEQVAA
jgi:hypothetical protein